eukprot:maker-scaffold61_size441589-snap-gene-3.35 protein:Tk06319 transcript:maker-scaffold61_size441589-snap-gene-3.35-mRNA-1 annotation:"hypothetical protein"
MFSPMVHFRNLKYELTAEPYWLSIFHKIHLLCVVAFGLVQARPDNPYEPPQPSYHVPERNCSVEFEKAEAEICVPTLETGCEEKEVTLKAPIEKEQCFTITTTECNAEVSEEEVKICVYVYEKEEKQTTAKIADVKYTKRCDSNYINVCQPKPSYGYNKEEEEVCKEVPQETCYNRPQTESKEKDLTVTIPKAVEKCETKRIQIPTVTCEDKKEERCFKLIALEETTQLIQKCTVSIAEPKCNEVSLNLPAQTCVEELKEYAHQSHGGYTQ